MTEEHHRSLRVFSPVPRHEVVKVTVAQNQEDNRPPTISGSSIKRKRIRSRSTNVVARARVPSGSLYYTIHRATDNWK